MTVRELESGQLSSAESLVQYGASGRTTLGAESDNWVELAKDLLVGVKY